MASAKKAAENKALERRRRVGTMMLQGMTYREIGKAEGVSYTTIGNDVRALRKQWVETSRATFEEHVAVELQRLNMVIAAAWEGWEASKGKKTVIKARLPSGPPTGDDEGQKLEAEILEKTVTSGNGGDPKFLQIIIKADERICAITGIEASRKLEIAATANMPEKNDNVPLDEFTDAEVLEEFDRLGKVLKLNVGKD